MPNKKQIKKIRFVTFKYKNTQTSKNKQEIKMFRNCILYWFIWKSECHIVSIGFICLFYPKSRISL